MDIHPLTIISDYQNNYSAMQDKKVFFRVLGKQLQYYQFMKPQWLDHELQVSYVKYDAYF